MVAGRKIQNNGLAHQDSIWLQHELFVYPRQDANYIFFIFSSQSYNNKFRMRGVARRRIGYLGYHQYQTYVAFFRHNVVMDIHQFFFINFQKKYFEKK